MPKLEPVVKCFVRLMNQGRRCMRMTWLEKFDLYPEYKFSELHHLDMAQEMLYRYGYQHGLKTRYAALVGCPNLCKDKNFVEDVMMLDYREPPPGIFDWMTDGEDGELKSWEDISIPRSYLPQNKPMDPELFPEYSRDYSRTWAELFPHSPPYFRMEQVWKKLKHISLDMALENQTPSPRKGYDCDAVKK